jgi:hypothetical protein
MYKRHENELLGSTIYIYLHSKRDTLVHEQQVNDMNPLFDLAYIPRDLQHIP